MKSFRDLQVWQKSVQVVSEIYRVTATFPTEERFGLVSQIRRAAVSMPSNIAEGFGRRSTAEYIRFLRMALGSAYEVQTQLEISKNLQFIDLQSSQTLDQQLDEIARMVNSLINKLRSRLSPADPG